MEPRLVKISKYLSKVLRHQPDRLGVKLDAQGWVAISELLKAASERGTHISDADLREVVAKNDKQRFSISRDGNRIRANQGHSIDVDLGYSPSTPPDTLYHGTAIRNLESIKESGLWKGSRQHVHLSADIETARRVGERHGKVVVLQVDAAKLHASGHVFYCSENHVWLTDDVPPAYLMILP